MEVKRKQQERNFSDKNLYFQRRYFNKDRKEKREKRVKLKEKTRFVTNFFELIS